MSSTLINRNVSIFSCTDIEDLSDLSSPVTRAVNNLPANAGDTRDVGFIPGSGRSPGVGNGNPLQCSCLENFMDRGVWQATVHGVAKCWTQLSTHRYAALIDNWTGSANSAKEKASKQQF